MTDTGDDDHGFPRTARVNITEAAQREENAEEFDIPQIDTYYGQLALAFEGYEGGKDPLQFTVEQATSLLKVFEAVTANKEDFNKFIADVSRYTDCPEEFIIRYVSPVDGIFKEELEAVADANFSMGTEDDQILLVIAIQTLFNHVRATDFFDPAFAKDFKKDWRPTFWGEADAAFEVASTLRRWARIDKEGRPEKPVSELDEQYMITELTLDVDFEEEDEDIKSDTQTVIVLDDDKEETSVVKHKPLFGTTPWMPAVNHTSVEVVMIEEKEDDVPAVITSSVIQPGVNDCTASQGPRKVSEVQQKVRDSWLARFESKQAREVREGGGQKAGGNDASSGEV